jgi:hypothetical protein
LGAAIAELAISANAPARQTLSMFVTPHFDENYLTAVIAQAQ